MSEKREELITYPYFSHTIDCATKYCIQCGKFLAELQMAQNLKGKQPMPKCNNDVIAISHLVRRVKAK